MADTTTSIAAGIAAAINAAVAAQGIAIGPATTPFYQNGPSGITAKSSTNVVTVSWHAVFAPVTIAASTSAGATESLTTAQYNDGSGTVVSGGILTGVGNIAFDQPAPWMKATITGYSAGTISGKVYGCLP